VTDDDTANLRRALEAFSGGDTDEALEAVAPDFQMRDHVILENAADPRGPNAVRENRRRLSDPFDGGMLVRAHAPGHASLEHGR
jgi:hypothetical protein